MKKYYFATTDTVYSNWSDSDLRHWLISNGIIKSDAQVTRDKMLKLVSYVVPQCARLLTDFFLFCIATTTYLRKILFGMLGQITISGNGLFQMDTCAQMPKLNATNSSDWQMRSSYLLLSMSIVCANIVTCQIQRPSC